MLLLVFLLLFAAPAQAASLMATWTPGAVLPDGSNRPDGFAIERHAGTTGTFAEIGRVGGSQLVYVDNALTMGQLYTYRVRAFNTAGMSGYSLEASGTADARAPPADQLTCIFSLDATGGHSVPIAYVQSAQNDAGSVTSATKAFTSNNVAGNLIIVAVRVGATGRTVTITDSRNTYQPKDISQVQTTDGHEIFIFHAENIGAGANTVQVAISGGAATVRFAIHEYSGLALSGALDRVNGGQADGATSISSGNVTTTVANELLFGFSGDSTSTTTYTAGASYVLREQIPAPNQTRAASEDRIVSATLVTDASFSIAPTTPTQNLSAIIATFRDINPQNPGYGTSINTPNLMGAGGLSS